MCKIITYLGICCTVGGRPTISISSIRIVVAVGFSITLSFAIGGTSASFSTSMYSSKSAFHSWSLLIEACGKSCTALVVRSLTVT